MICVVTHTKRVRQLGSALTVVQGLMQMAFQQKFVAPTHLLLVKLVKTVLVMALVKMV